MRQIGSALLVAFAIEIIIGLPSQASIINFGDIDASAGDVILASYQSYNWTSISVYTSTTGFPGYNNGIVSAPNAAYTAGDMLGSSTISTVSSSDPFNFISGYFGSGWYDGLSVTVNGLYNGTQDFSQTFTVNTEAPQFLTLNFDNINELDIYSTVTASTTDPYGCGPSGCSQVTLDDITLTPASGLPPPPVSTPEPTSFVLAAFGGLLLAVIQGRRVLRQAV